MGRCQALAICIDNQAGEQARLFGTRTIPPLAPIAFERALYRLPEFRIDDGLVHPFIALSLVGDATAIDGILQQVVKRTCRDRPPSTSFAIGIRAQLTGDAFGK